MLILGATFLLYLSFYYQPNWLPRFFEELPVTLTVLLVLAGLPALLGNLVRLLLMHRVFREAASTTGLLLSTALVSEGVVAVFWGVWQLYQQSGLPIPYIFRVPIMQQIDDSLVLFFGLSLPRLLSSVWAAWHLRRTPGGRPTAPEQEAATA